MHALVSIMMMMLNPSFLQMLQLIIQYNLAEDMVKCHVQVMSQDLLIVSLMSTTNVSTLEMPE